MFLQRLIAVFAFLAVGVGLAALPARTPLAAAQTISCGGGVNATWGSSWQWLSTNYISFSSYSNCNGRNIYSLEARSRLEVYDTNFNIWVADATAPTGYCTNCSYTASSSNGSLFSGQTYRVRGEHWFGFSSTYRIYVTSESSWIYN